MLKKLIENKFVHKIDNHPYGSVAQVIGSHCMMCSIFYSQCKYKKLCISVNGTN